MGDQCKIPEWAPDEEVKPLEKLRVYQATEIEHKEPKQHQQFYYTEAIGDIYRELTKRFYASNYINEKLRKIKTFKKDYLHAEGQDELERCRYYIENEKEYKEEANKWFKKLDEFSNVIKESEINECRKEVLLEIPELQKEFIYWALYYTDARSVSELLKDFTNKVEERIG